MRYRSLNRIDRFDVADSLLDQRLESRRDVAVQISDSRMEELRRSDAEPHRQTHVYHYQKAYHDPFHSHPEPLAALNQTRTGLDRLLLDR